MVQGWAANNQCLATMIEKVEVSRGLFSYPLVVFFPVLFFSQFSSLLPVSIMFLHSMNVT